MRSAACQCGKVTIQVHGEPVRVSACHCLDCQKRSGSAFAVQARFRNNQVVVSGDLSCFVRVSDDAIRVAQHFCPTCGTGIYYHVEDDVTVLAIPVGLFADPQFPPPQISVYEHRKHPWVMLIGDTLQHR